LGIFLAFGELCDFLGNFESQLLESIFSKIWQKYEDFSVTKHVPPYFFKLFITRYRYTYIAENLPHFGGILCIFWGILGDF
jgi:hypothetical protein